MMLINIRDDDTNYFTKPDELISAYGEYWSILPITLACTPFVSSHSFVMETLDGDRIKQFMALDSLEKSMDAESIAEMNRIYPLGDNKELVGFLRPLINASKIEIALHGHTHRFYPNGAEFINKHINYYNVRDGKLYFERLLNTSIEFFVPPSNKIDRTSINFLRKERLHILTSGVITCFSLCEKISVYTQLVLQNPILLKGIARKKLITGFLKFNGVNFFRGKTFMLDDTFESFINRHQKQMNEDGFISIATHYTALYKNKNYRDRFFKLLDFLIKKYPTAEFVTMKALLTSLSEKNEDSINW